MTKMAELQTMAFESQLRVALENLPGALVYARN